MNVKHVLGPLVPSSGLREPGLHATRGQLKIRTAMIRTHVMDRGFVRTTHEPGLLATRGQLKIRTAMTRTHVMDRGFVRTTCGRMEQHVKMRMVTAAAGADYVTIITVSSGHGGSVKNVVHFFFQAWPSNMSPSRFGAQQELRNKCKDRLPST